MRDGVGAVVDISYQSAKTINKSSLVIVVQVQKVHLVTAIGAAWRILQLYAGLEHHAKGHIENTEICAHL